MCVGGRNLGFYRNYCFVGQIKYLISTSSSELPFNSECHFWKYGLLQKEQQNKNWYWKVYMRYIFLSFTMNCYNLRIEWLIMQHYSKYWEKTVKNSIWNVTIWKLLGAVWWTMSGRNFCHPPSNFGNLIWSLQNVEKPPCAFGKCEESWWVATYSFPHSC